MTTKTKELKELSRVLREHMQYARSKGVSAKQVRAMRERANEMAYAFEDVEGGED